MHFSDLHFHVRGTLRELVRSTFDWIDHTQEKTKQTVPASSEVPFLKLQAWTREKSSVAFKSQGNVVFENVVVPK
ncbi:hypothetical protein AMECASPLE_014259 [Ameca splendens]|uniref:Uncharacterized protein n=1 Tax=Ameca splendens TaxID=208324 RepID=A0ABV0YCS5_9TELE